MNFDWHLPTRVIFGPGRLSCLPEVLSGLGARRVLLVTGAAAMSGHGILQRVLDSLVGFEVRVHEGVRVNLPVSDCEELIKSAREHEAEAVVGLGGGSVLDGAKAAAWLATEEGECQDYLTGQKPCPKKSIPFIAVPTTAGTGSEVTPSIILLDTEKKRKVSLSGKQALARAAIVDPQLTLTLPPEQTAATGLDALSHGFEAYWSKHATPFSDLFALSALSSVLSSLRTAYHHPQDLGARTHMSLAALSAGMALAHTATAAVHGLTYPLTAHYGVPHGLACAFLLAEVFSVNFYHLSPARQKQLLFHLNANTLAAGQEVIIELCQELNVPQTLTDLGVPERDLHRLAQEATPANLDRNIAPLSPEKILELWYQKKG